MDKNLAALYPPNSDKYEDQDLWVAIKNAIDRNMKFALERLQSAPQTNEVRRSGILVPGFMEIAEVTGLSKFVMSEVGASAGLNLIWDAYSYTLAGKAWGDETSGIHLQPEWEGDHPKFSEITVIGREGCDLFPINLEDEQQCRRLQSYIWPDQEDRMRRTQGAIELFKKSAETVKAEDAIPWLKRRLDERHNGMVHVVYNSIAWQYLPEDSQKAGMALLQKAGEQATPDAPLAWLSLEADGKGPGAALMLTVWPAGETRELARGDFHGRWVKWF
ncbi:MAG: DUF2332 family protein [Sneathiella sp.]|nr:DUF2332 family protein [Sneathiella sp.]